MPGEYQKKKTHTRRQLLELFIISVMLEMLGVLNVSDASNAKCL